MRDKNDERVRNVHIIMNPDCKMDFIEIERCKLKTRDEVDRFIEQLLLSASAVWPEILEDGGDAGARLPNNPLIGPVGN